MRRSLNGTARGALIFVLTTEAAAHAASPIRVLPKRPLKPKKMLKIGLHWVTANRGQPDASDLRAAGFRRDRLRRNVLQSSCQRCNEYNGGLGQSLIEVNQ